MREYINLKYKDSMETALSIVVRLESKIEDWKKKSISKNEDGKLTRGQKTYIKIQTELADDLYFAIQGMDSAIEQMKLSQEQKQKIKTQGNRIKELESKIEAMQQMYLWDKANTARKISHYLEVKKDKEYFRRLSIEAAKQKYNF